MCFYRQLRKIVVLSLMKFKQVFKSLNIHYCLWKLQHHERNAWILRNLQEMQIRVKCVSNHKITRQPHMCDLSNALNIFEWHLYINNFRHALKSVYRYLFAINQCSICSKRGVLYKQFTNFDRNRRIGMREDEFSFREITARTGRNATTIMRVRKRWTEEKRTSAYPSITAHTIMSLQNNRHLTHMIVTERMA